MTTMTTSPAASSHGSVAQSTDRTSFEEAAALALAGLQRACRSLLEAIPGGVRKAADLQRAFNVDSKLAGQVFKVATAPEPIAAGANVPPRVSLERLLRSASGQRIPAPLIDRVAEAFDDFERMVQEQAGDRNEFDALIAATIPEARGRMMLASRQMMYSAARNVRGVAVEASVYTLIFFPSRDDPETLEVVRLNADLGLRRIHRGARVLESSGLADANAQVLTIDGRPIVDQASVMLEPFCSTPIPKYRCVGIHKPRRWIWYELEGEDVGIRAAVDAVRADFVRPSFKNAYWSAERPQLRAIKDSHFPTRWQVVDILACEGFASHVDQDAFVHDVLPTGDLIHGAAPPGGERNIAFVPPVRYMGAGLNAFACSHVPRYEEMVAYICEQRGWDASRLQGFRVEIEYPVYSWQTVLSVGKSTKPDAGVDGRQPRAC